MSDAIEELREAVRKQQFQIEGLERRLNELLSPASTKQLTLPGTTDELTELLVWWNRLHEAGLVPHAVRPEKPSEAVLSAWAKAIKHRDMLAALRDHKKMESEIRLSPFCREPWFRLESLIFGRNKDGEFHILKLMDGGFRGNGRHEQRQPTSPVRSNRTRDW